jgi:hypothetical protein
VAVERFDESLTLESAKRLVEGARCKPHSGERLDVLGQGIAMLGPLREAGEDQGRGAGVATERTEWLGWASIVLGCFRRSCHKSHRISADDPSAVGRAVTRGTRYGR